MLAVVTLLSAAGAVFTSSANAVTRCSEATPAGYGVTITTCAQNSGGPHGSLTVNDILSRVAFAGRPVAQCTVVVEFIQLTPHKETVKTRDCRKAALRHETMRGLDYEFCHDDKRYAVAIAVNLTLLTAQRVETKRVKSPGSVPCLPPTT
jgi:hypothetical protein